MRMNVKNGHNVIVLAIFGEHDSPAFKMQSKDFVQVRKDNFFEINEVLFLGTIQ